MTETPYHPCISEVNKENQIAITPFLFRKGVNITIITLHYDIPIRCFIVLSTTSVMSLFGCILTFLLYYQISDLRSASHNHSIV